MKYAGDTTTMLSVAETVSLMESGLTEMQTLCFRRRKQREKQRT